jgi:hypothetical protein
LTNSAVPADATAGLPACVKSRQIVLPLFPSPAFAEIGVFKTIGFARPTT